MGVGEAGSLRGLTQAELDAIPEIEINFSSEERVVKGRLVRVPVQAPDPGAMFDPVYVVDAHGQRWAVGEIKGVLKKRRVHDPSAWAEKNPTTLLEAWRDEYVHPTLRLCGLCGNSGVIDTRGHVKSNLGEDCGIQAYCICPNGRRIKSLGWPLNWQELQKGKR